MSSITSDMARQYSDSQKLAAQARINLKYTVAEIGWFPWVARQLPLHPSDRVLDIGCGPGWFWAATRMACRKSLTSSLRIPVVSQTRREDVNKTIAR